MTLLLQRFHSSANDTLGLLFIDSLFAAFVMEDEKREVKIPGETRIPAGQYDVQLSHSPKMSAKYGGRDMPEVVNVPGFTGIRIHAGNTEKDTEGCLLLGNVARFNPAGDSRVEESRVAFDRLWALMDRARTNGEKMKITVMD